MAKRKNPAAVALGRLGGRVKSDKKGFGSLGVEERKVAAASAAKVRWDAYREAQKIAQK